MEAKGMSLEDLIKREKGNKRGGAAGQQRGGKFGRGGFKGGRGGEVADVPRVRGQGFKRDRGAREGGKFAKSFGQGQRIPRVSTF